MFGKIWRIEEDKEKHKKLKLLSPFSYLNVFKEVLLLIFNCMQSVGIHGILDPEAEITGSSVLN